MWNDGLYGRRNQLGQISHVCYTRGCTINKPDNALLNYTTKIPAHTSIAEISRLLARSGAKAVMHDFDEDGNVQSLSFSMVFNGNTIGFRLPANWQGIQPIMEQKRRQDSRHVPVEFTQKQHCI